MMRILVTKEKGMKSKFPDYLIVSSAGEAVRTKGVIKLLVVDSSGGEESKGKPSLFPQLIKKCSLVVYASKSRVNEHLKLLVEGVNGIFLENDMYLKDQKTLEMYLTKFYGVNIKDPKPIVGKELATTGINSVLETFENVDKDEPLSPQSRELMVRTVKEYSHQVDLFIEDKRRSAKSALDYAEQNANIYAQLSNLNNDLRARVDEYASLIDSQTSTRGGGLALFPKFNLNTTLVKSHIKVKKIGSGVFCMSFIMGLKAYLVRRKNIRAQVIVLLPETRYYQDIYSNYPWITSSSNKDGAAYASEVVMVGYPTKGVLNRLVNNDGFYESLIFLDMMTQGVEHLVKSRKRTWIFSSSPKLIQRLNMPIGNTIFSLKEQEGAAFYYKSWQNYPDKIGDRERAYIDKAGDMYSSMFESSL